MDANKTGPRRPKKPRLTALNRLDIEACLNDGKPQKSPFVCNACPDRNKCVLKPSLLGLEVKVKEWVSKDESGKRPEPLTRTTRARSNA